MQTPQFKAGIERLFGTLNTKLFHTLPGTTFGSISQRGDYDSEAEACICLRDLQQMLTMFVVDVYAEQFHRGLQGVPVRCWEQALHAGFVPRVPGSADDLLVLLGRSVHRVIHPYGIEFETLRYNCAALGTLRQRLAGQPVKVKYHPADLSRMYVYDPVDHRYITVPALAQEYTAGLSLWKHRVIRRAVLVEQQTVDLAALGRAKRKIQEVVTAARKEKPVHTRARMARWGTQRPQTPAPADAAPSDSRPSATDPAVLFSDDGSAGDGWTITYPSCSPNERPPRP
ncbi:MAG TPA: Mu transposase C-terminal domain-containing protein [Herpetosiphonaceae bacterium]|nr:Mu transposase C-terminal domain-containing protein [Herpetosiphonaceae bacterium]